LLTGGREGSVKGQKALVEKGEDGEEKGAEEAKSAAG
jgi:hypothetical protein